MANHVLYLWREASAELVQLHGFLRPGGLLALGYQLRQNSSVWECRGQVVIVDQLTDPLDVIPVRAKAIDAWRPGTRAM